MGLAQQDLKLTSHGKSLKKKKSRPRKDENTPNDKNQDNGAALPRESAILFINEYIACPCNGFRPRIYTHPPRIFNIADG
jgi:hypothetical protein